MRYSTIMATAFVGLAFVGLATVASAQDTTQAPTRLPSAKVTAELGKVVTVQNDRREAVRFFIEAGTAERMLGLVPPNSTSELQLPTWTVNAKRSIVVLAVAENSAQVIARYQVPLVAGQMMGLLVPPSEGLPAGDSIFIALPKGMGTTATVTVENTRAHPVAIFAEQGLRFVRLGEIAANTQGTLPLPSSMLSGKEGVRIFARPGGAAERSTQSLKLRGGDHIAVIVM